ncbi:MAG: hypothetical protein KDH20_01840 [Rhodocyclaceae bacterium]|nr:hypothetical protein [Rhodocyclaceae bacterium]
MFSRRILRTLALVAGAAGALAPQAGMAQCVVTQPAPPTEPESPEHHPVGRELPARPGFAQPDGCTDAFWFFDQDGDGQADDAEPRLYGPRRAVVCGSCHTDAPPDPGGVAFEVFLRQEPATLCLVCHSI